jgi:hypothetical protein
MTSSVLSFDVTNMVLLKQTCILSPWASSQEYWNGICELLGLFSLLLLCVQACYISAVSTEITILIEKMFQIDRIGSFVSRNRDVVVAKE